MSHWRVDVYNKGEKVYTKVVKSKKASTAIVNVLTNHFRDDSDQAIAYPANGERKLPIKEENKMTDFNQLRVTVSKEQAVVLARLMNEGFTADSTLAIIEQEKNDRESEFANMIRILSPLGYTKIVMAFEFGFEEEKTMAERIKSMFDLYYGDMMSNDYDRKSTGRTGCEVIQETLRILEREIPGISDIELP